MNMANPVQLRCFERNILKQLACDCDEKDWVPDV